MINQLPGKLGMTDKNFWQNKRVFLTGHTGFKGAWMSLWLNELGAKVHGYALAPNTSPALFDVLELSESIESTIGDIRDLDKLKKAMGGFAPEIVIHMAAQPLVRKSYLDPVDTYSTNVMGTVNLLEAVRGCSSVKYVLNVTTDKVYENKELDVPFKEEDRLGGFDPYSNSKACSELVTASYISSFFSKSGVKVVTARAGNVIGGGDWAEDRLIPDIIRSSAGNKEVTIRNPKAIRPWQHVLESISGYLKLIEFLSAQDETYPLYWNFGPGAADFMNVQDICDFISINFPELSLKFVYESSPLHEAQLLKLDNSLAKKNLDWASHWSSKIAISKTMEWYKSFINGSRARELCLQQIKEFNT